MKKNNASWYIAATHYLTAGLVVPFICNIIFAYISIFLQLSGPVVYVFAFVVVVISVWGGVMYSAKYINRKYVIQNINSIVNLSTLYLVVIRLLYTFGKIKQVGSVNQPELIYTIVSLLVTFILFYILSKKYISKYQISQTV